MSGPFSPTSPTPLAFYDPESWSWRTSQGCLLSEAPESLQRLPDWGTTSDGVLYELQMPELLIAARDGSALLGTPTLPAGPRSARFRSKNPNMAELAALLPTPRAQNGEERNMKPWMRPLDEPQNLENALARLPGAILALPSPDGSESSDGQHPHPPTTGNCPAGSSSG